MGKGGSHLKGASGSAGRNGGKRAAEHARTVHRTTAETRAPAPEAAQPVQQPGSYSGNSFEDIERRLAAEQAQRQSAGRQPQAAARSKSSSASARRSAEPRRDERSRASAGAAGQSRRPAPSAEQPPRRSDAPRRTEPAAPRNHAQAPAPRRAAAAPGMNPPASNPPTRKRKKKKGGAGLWIVIGLIGAVMLFSLFMLGKALFGYAGDRNTDSELQAAAIKPKLPTTTAAADAEEETTAVQSEVPFEVDWQLLKETNSDIIGWLYSPTIQSINYPVVQTANNEDYLYTDFNGKDSSGGTLFADYNSVVGLRSSHLIIYGHNMKDNSKFGKLKEYLTEEFYEENPIFYFMTPDQDYRVELLDCQTIDASLDNYPTYFSAEGTSLNEYIARLTANAYWVNQEADYENYQLMTMSTCTSSDDERLILQGVLVPIE